MSLMEKIDQLESQLGERVGQVVRDFHDQVRRRIDQGQKELLGRLEELTAELPEGLLARHDLEPLADQAGAEARAQSHEELLASLRALDGVTSQAEALNALLAEAGRHASRTALFLTRADGARVWGSHGWAAEGAALDGLTVDYEEGPWRQLQEGQGAVALRSSDCAELCSRIEAPLPADGILVPMVIRDRLAAALYADRMDEHGALSIPALQALTYATALVIESLPFRDRDRTPTLGVAGATGVTATALPLWDAPAGEPTPAPPEAVADDEPAAAAEAAPAEPEAELEAVADTEPQAPEALETIEEPEAASEEPEAEPEPAAAAEPEAMAAEPEPEAPADDEIELAGLDELEIEETDVGPWSLDEARTGEEPTADEAAPAAALGPRAIAEPAPEPVEEPAEEPAEMEEPEPEPDEAAAASDEASPWAIAEEEPWTAPPAEEAEPRQEARDTVLLDSSQLQAVPPALPEQGPDQGPEQGPEQVPEQAPETAEPPPPPPASAAQHEGADAEAEAGTAQVTPPSDVEGPGWAFATSRVAADGGIDQAAHEEARRLARLLVSEIRLYNEEQVEEGRRNRDLYERLREDIQRSRQMYEERVDDSVRGENDYFRQELIRILADGDADVLGMMEE